MSQVSAPAAPSPDPMAGAGGTRPRVAVVFGGRSGEHAISCVTAAGVLGAIDRGRYDVVPVGITRSGRWVLVEGDPAALGIVDGRLPEVPADGVVVALAQEVGSRELQPVAGDRAPHDLGTVDVVLPLLHGPYGEDGTLQGLLELSDTRYVGSGVLASAASMDKQVMKVLLTGAGLPVGPHTSFTRRRWERREQECRAEVEALGWPVFVKPARAGSSIGISRVERPEDLAAAVAQAQRHDPKVVVEAAITGREIECGVLEALDGGDPLTSLPGEVAVVDGRSFYDFEAKYLVADEAVRLSCPADLPAELTRRVRETAARVFEALGAEGLARVDLFVCDDGRIYVNEINTMPGFTPTSMFPRMWAATGVDYPDLVDHLLQLALRRPVGLR
ncbi:D-alanine--D-alanine ligase family protein [Kineococcus glutinatus]|uniref:D-alanine--D-alanine ligase n=1 Tax=Kineococcus glutinatus TaxID=1070872 RepID=A0ABP8VG45_9ACTN